MLPDLQTGSSHSVGGLVPKSGICVPGELRTHSEHHQRKASRITCDWIETAQPGNSQPYQGETKHTAITVRGARNGQGSHIA